MLATFGLAADRGTNPVSGARFCKRHASYFCPCVAAWLYSARERADYERGRWSGERIQIQPPPQPRRESEQMRLA